MNYQNKHFRVDDKFPITMIAKCHFILILISLIVAENLVMNILLEIMSHLVLWLEEIVVEMLAVL